MTADQYREFVAADTRPTRTLTREQQRLADEMLRESLRARQESADVAR